MPCSTSAWPDGTIVVGGVHPSSTDLSVPGAAQPGFGGYYDAFLQRYANDGTALLYGSYLGGKRIDSIQALGVDAQGHVVFGGYTGSRDFPVSAMAQQGAWASGQFNDSEGFVGVLRAGGTFDGISLYGGDQRDEVRAVAVDAEGNATFAGLSNSSNLFTRNAAQPGDPFPGYLDGTRFVRYLDTDAFVLRILSRDDGHIALRNVAAQALAGTPFDGLVATFSTTGSEGADQFTATCRLGRRQQQ